MNWLRYLVEANVYLGVFYLCYCLFLNRETHYTLSRAYLLFSCVVAFVLPVTQLSILKPAEQPAVEQPFANMSAEAMMLMPPPPPPEPPPLVSWQDGLLYVYIIGAVAALCVFAVRLYQLYKLSRHCKQKLNNSYQLVQLQDDNTAFSFFNYLFIGTNISQSDTVIAHELVHIRQKHSLDIIFLELLKVVSWFNPFIYLVQRSLKTVHEYIADEQTAARERDALAYSSFLLNNAYGIQGSTIAHSFFNYNLLKKRIIMLNKNRSGRLARLKYLAAVPLCAGMLCASTLVFSKDYAFIDLAPKEANKVVKVKRLKMFLDGMTMYSDNVSVTLKDGTRRKFDVKTITKADIKYLLIRHKIKVEIIEVDSAKYRGNPLVQFPEQQKTDTIKRRLPPPPPKIDKKLADLFKHIAKYTRYPAKARDNKIDGNILLSLKLDADRKITDVNVVKGIGYGCDEEAVRAVKSYTGSLNSDPGYYNLVVKYALFGDNNAPIHRNQPVKPGSAQYPWMGEVQVTAYIAGMKGLPPPPPPAPPRPLKSGKVKPAPALPVVKEDIPPPPPPAEPVKKLK